MINFKKEIIPLIISCIILILFEIISTTVFPIIGIENIRIPFHVLIILYMGFKLDTAWLGVLIFIIMVTHSFFTIEGWEMELLRVLSLVRVSLIYVTLSI